jgi:hypothetical protein
MKFFIVLTMLAVSGLAAAQSSASPSTVTPTASGSTTSPDSSGTMNTDAEDMKNKNIDSTKTEEQRMEDSADRGLDSAEGSINDNTDMNTVPSQNPASTTTP